MTEAPDQQPLTAHAARAELVDLIASYRSSAQVCARVALTDIAGALTRVADQLTDIVRRWDIAADHGN